MQIPCRFARSACVAQVASRIPPSSSQRERTPEGHRCVDSPHSAFFAHRDPIYMHVTCRHSATSQRCVARKPITWTRNKLNTLQRAQPPAPHRGRPINHSGAAHRPNLPSHLQRDTGILSHVRTSPEGGLPEVSPPTSHLCCDMPITHA